MTAAVDELDLSGELDLSNIGDSPKAFRRLQTAYAGGNGPFIWTSPVCYCFSSGVFRAQTHLLTDSESLIVFFSLANPAWRHVAAETGHGVHQLAQAKDRELNSEPDCARVSLDMTTLTPF